MNTTSSKSSSETLKVDPEVKRVAGPSAEAICDVHRKHLLPNLDAYRKPREPDTPTIFSGMNDGEILHTIKEARAKRSKSDDNERALRWFGVWRKGVIRWEERCEGNILVLLRAAASFVQIGDEGASYRVLAFAGNEYGFHFSDAPEGYHEHLRIARKFSKVGDTFPDRLMEEGYRRPFKEKAEVEPSQIDMDEVF